MKVSFFHLMPYQDLPDDFAEQHHSAWVDLPNENFDPAKGNEYYAQYIEQLRYADEAGFDGICVNEHHNNAYGIMPSPNLIASVLANSHQQRRGDSARATAWRCTTLQCGWLKRWR